MEIYNYGPEVTKLIESYLIFKSQQLNIERRMSEFLWKKNEVPQSSIIGPFLFYIYVKKLSVISNINCVFVRPCDE